MPPDPLPSLRSNLDCLKRIRDVVLTVIRPRKVFFKMQVYILLAKNLSLVGADYEIEGVISNRDIVERWIANVLEDGPFARKFVTFELDDPYLLSILAQED